MRILGIDTATWRASVGLCDGAHIISEQSQPTHGNHATVLLPLIERVLRAADWPLRSLDAIAVSGGPGSFTGLRVGLSVAKGLARAADLPIVTVPTLEALARTVADAPSAVCALLDARKGELYAGCFAASAAGWTRLMADSLLRPETLVERLPTPCVVLGDAVIAYADFLLDRLGSSVTILPFDHHAPHGGCVAVLGAERLHADGPADLRSLEPFYIRRSEAETKAA